MERQSGQKFKMAGNTKMHGHPPSNIDDEINRRSSMSTFHNHCRPAILVAIADH